MLIALTLDHEPLTLVDVPDEEVVAALARPPGECALWLNLRLVPADMAPAAPPAEVSIPIQ